MCIKVSCLLLALVAVACQQTGNAPKLQGHLAQAKTSAAKTGKHLDVIDYKASRAKKLLDQGIERPN